jgi:hypothetical protein
MGLTSAEMSPGYVALDLRSCRKNQGSATLQEIVKNAR